MKICAKYFGNLNGSPGFFISVSSQGWELAGHCGPRQPARVPRQSASGVWARGIFLVWRSARGQFGLRAAAPTTHQPQPQQYVGLQLLLSRPHTGPTHPTSLFFFLSSADSFETMLKSLLGYQAGTGGGPTDSVIRKKVYQSAIDVTLKNNFPLVLKVCVMVEKKETSVFKLYLLIFLLFISWWQSWWRSGSPTQRPSTPLCVPTSWSWPWRPSLSWPWARAAATTPGSFHSARTTMRWVFLVSLTSSFSRLWSD